MVENVPLGRWRKGKWGQPRLTQGRLTKLSGALSFASGIPVYFHLSTAQISQRNEDTQLLTPPLHYLAVSFLTFVLWAESMISAAFHRRNEGIQKTRTQTVLISRRVFVPRRSRCLYTTGPKRPQGWRVTTVSQQTLNKTHYCFLICNDNVINKQVSLSRVGMLSTQREILFFFRKKDYKEQY